MELKENLLEEDIQHLIPQSKYNKQAKYPEVLDSKDDSTILKVTCQFLW